MIKVLTIKITARDAGIGSIPDPWGRDYIYYAEAKGKKGYGDTVQEAVQELYHQLGELEIRRAK